MATYCVIFGAAVRPDGEPSGTLRRRVEGAFAVAKDYQAVRFLCSGGRGASGYVEAVVMREVLLRSGIPSEAIILESRGRDTLQQAKLCAAILRRAGDVETVIPCTSRYHVPRCALLLRILGLPVRTASMPSDWGHTPIRKLCWFHIKELLACPYDVLLLLIGNREVTNHVG